MGPSCSLMIVREDESDEGYSEENPSHLIPIEQCSKVFSNIVQETRDAWYYNRLLYELSSTYAATSQQQASQRLQYALQGDDSTYLTRVVSNRSVGVTLQYIIAPRCATLRRYNKSQPGRWFAKPTGSLSCRESRDNSTSTSIPIRLSPISSPIGTGCHGRPHRANQFSMGKKKIIKHKLLVTTVQFYCGIAVRMGTGTAQQLATPSSMQEGVLHERTQVRTSTS